MTTREGCNIISQQTILASFWRLFIFFVRRFVRTIAIAYGIHNFCQLKCKCKFADHRTHTEPQVNVELKEPAFESKQFWFHRNAIVWTKKKKKTSQTFAQVPFVVFASFVLSARACMRTWGSTKHLMCFSLSVAIFYFFFTLLWIISVLFVICL